MITIDDKTGFELYTLKYESDSHSTLKHFVAIYVAKIYSFEIFAEVKTLTTKAFPTKCKFEDLKLYTDDKVRISFEGCLDF